MSCLAFRIWDKFDKRYVAAVDACVTKTGCLFIDGRVADRVRYETELCTGVEDELGNLIYENDELEAPNGNRSVVVWKNGSFVLESGNELMTLYPFKIVGRKNG